MNTEPRTRPPVVWSHLWQASGCPPDGHPPVIQQMTTKQVECDVMDPVTGVTAVTITAPNLTLHAYGDDTGGVFLRVWGRDHDAVAAMYDRATAIMPTLMHHLWNSPLSTVA